MYFSLFSYSHDVWDFLVANFTLQTYFTKFLKKQPIIKKSVQPNVIKSGKLFPYVKVVDYGLTCWKGIISPTVYNLKKHYEEWDSRWGVKTFEDSNLGKIFIKHDIEKLY
jgi:hypothetical protein